MWLGRDFLCGNLDLLQRCAFYEVRSKTGTCTWTKTDPRVVFFQEHRMALPVIWAALQDDLFSSSQPLLVRIDAHTDYAEEKVNYEEARSKIKTIEDCILFANAIDHDDGGWVEAAIKLDWVSDVICLYVQPSEWRFFKDAINDINGKPHAIHVYPDPADGPPDLGCGPVSLDPGPLNGLIAGTDSRPIWLDIDLDFAVENVKDADARVLTPEMLVKKLARPNFCVESSHSALAVDAMAGIMDRARLITIASEPEFCRGFGGVSIILEGMRKAFPKHQALFSWYERGV